jgi:hypothetical protein
MYAAGEPVQIVRELLLSEESDEGPDGSLVNRGRGMLFCSWAEQGIMHKHEPPSVLH